MLNAHQIIDEGLLQLERTHGKPAQVGYDLSLKQVNKLESSVKIGKVLKDKTESMNYIPYGLMNLDAQHGWLLHACVYDITFNE